MRAAEQNLQGMYEAYDWIMGFARPELGGNPSLVDVVGWNFYPHNQWYFEGPTIPMGHHEYRPLADMLIEVAERYGKPIFLSETGAEGSAKPSWLHYVCNEVSDAIDRGADIGASAGTRSPPIRAGTTAGMPRLGCCRRSSPTGPDTSTSDCSQNLRRSDRGFRRHRSSTAGVSTSLSDRRGLKIVGRSSDEGPTVAPLDLVYQKDPAAVDLVLLPLAPGRFTSIA